MRKSPFFILFLILAAGVAGYLLRENELRKAFEPVTGLAVHGAISTVYVFSASLLFMLLACALAFFIYLKFQSPDGYSNTFRSYSPVYPSFVIPICVVWIAGSIVHIVNLRRGGLLESVDIYFTVFSIVAAICLLLFTIEMFQQVDRKSSYALSLVSIVFLCFWLVLQYRDNAANPVLQSFVYESLAIISGILTFYYTTGFLYGKPAPAKTTVVYCFTIYFCMVAAADAADFGMLLIYGAIVAFTAMHLLLLLLNLERKETVVEINDSPVDENVENVEITIDK